MIDVSVKGLQEAQAAAERAAKAISPDGTFGLDNAVQRVTVDAERYAVAHTPKDTGTWRASHRPEVKGLLGRIYLDPAAVNPKSHTLASMYGPMLESARSGRYAVYRNTVNDAGPGLVNAALERLRGTLP